METAKHKAISLFLPEDYFLEKPLMVDVKKFIYTHFEKIVVGIVVILTALTHFLVINKLMFLEIYFLPTLLASYILGRRSGVSVAVFSVAMVAYFVVVSPARYIMLESGQTLSIDLILWGCFLVLTSIVVGSLYEQNKEQNAELRSTYEGVLEILVKFIDSVDEYTKGHSQRVAELATEMAVNMNLPERQTETIRVAALLHDIGKVDVSTDVILKAAKLSEAEINELRTHVEKGAVFLKPFQRLFKDAVSIVLSHHKYYDNSGYGGEDIVLDKFSKVSLGVLTIADAYDAMISDRPYRTGKTPREAVAEIRKSSGKQFDPILVKKFIEVMKDRLQTS